MVLSKALQLALMQFALTNKQKQIEEMFDNDTDSIKNYNANLQKGIKALEKGLGPRIDSGFVEDMGLKGLEKSSAVTLDKAVYEKLKSLIDNLYDDDDEPIFDFSSFWADNVDKKSTKFVICKRTFKSVSKPSEYQYVFIESNDPNSFKSATVNDEFEDIGEVPDCMPKRKIVEDSNYYVVGKNYAKTLPKADKFDKFFEKEYDGAISFDTIKKFAQTSDPDVAWKYWEKKFETLEEILFGRIDPSYTTFDDTDKFEKRAKSVFDKYISLLSNCQNMLDFLADAEKIDPSFLKKFDASDSENTNTFIGRFDSFFFIDENQTAVDAFKDFVKQIAKADLFILQNLMKELQSFSEYIRPKVEQWIAEFLTSVKALKISKSTSLSAAETDFNMFVNYLHDDTKWEKQILLELFADEDIKNTAFMTNFRLLGLVNAYNNLLEKGKRLKNGDSSAASTDKLYASSKKIVTPDSVTSADTAALQAYINSDEFTDDFANLLKFIKNDKIKLIIYDSTNNKLPDVIQKNIKTRWLRAHFYSIGDSYGNRSDAKRSDPDFKKAVEEGRLIIPVLDSKTLTFKIDSGSTKWETIKQFKEIIPTFVLP